MSIVLECKSLTKKYGATTALDHIDLTLETGHIIGLLGPNGSGKTTLIKLASGLLVPDSGTLTVGGFTPGVFTKQHVAYLPERTYLNERLTVDETIDYFSDFFDDFDVLTAYELFRHLNIDTAKRIKTFSKGNKEKIQLILVMSRKASLYLLDEPIAGVDLITRDYILNLIKTQFRPDSAIILSTHLISDVEGFIDEAVFVQNAKVVCHESTAELLKDGKSLGDAFREVIGHVS